MKGLNEDDSALIEGICVFRDLEMYPWMDNDKLVPSILSRILLQDTWQHY